MPANVTIDFEKAKLEYQQANSLEAKLAALLRMQSLAPAHKGGENLRRDISKKIATLKKELEKKKRQGGKKGAGSSIAVKKEGIGQVAIVGVPNSGKSTLLNLLTGIGTKVALYPFTTKRPAVGMMDYFGGKVQLVELPAIVAGSSSGKADGPQVISLARNANAVIVVGPDRGQRNIVERELLLSGLSLNKREKGRDFKKALFINAFEEHDIGELKERVFGLLDRIIVYTKKPGQEPDYEMPLGLALNATVKDVAGHLHKDIEKRFRFARVWGSTRFPGQRVSKDYELKNRDVVEILA